MFIICIAAVSIIALRTEINQKWEEKKTEEKKTEEKKKIGKYSSETSNELKCHGLIPTQFAKM